MRVAHLTKQSAITAGVWPLKEVSGLGGGSQQRFVVSGLGGGSQQRFVVSEDGEGKGVVSRGL